MTRSLLKKLTVTAEIAKSIALHGAETFVFRGARNHDPMFYYPDDEWMRHHWS